MCQLSASAGVSVPGRAGATSATRTRAASRPRTSQTHGKEPTPVQARSAIQARASAIICARFRDFSRFRLAPPRRSASACASTAPHRACSARLDARHAELRRPHAVLDEQWVSVSHRSAYPVRPCGRGRSPAHASRLFGASLQFWWRQEGRGSPIVAAMLHGSLYFPAALLRRCWIGILLGLVAVGLIVV